MREITLNEIDAVGGAAAQTQGAWAADAILTASGALVGFCLTGGNPAGAWLGGSLGHAYALIIID